MRIIGGSLKGKKIFQPSDKKTRPLRDLVKESIFNLIEHSNKIEINIQSSNVLDLFSGCGSFGLECISRGARRVNFIENYATVFKILQKNISLINAEKKTKVNNLDCFDYFNNEKNLSEKYEIIFLDPPFNEKRVNNLIEIIKTKKILKRNGIIIIHRHKKDSIDISENLKILDIRKYGISKIIIGN